MIFLLKFCEILLKIDKIIKMEKTRSSFIKLIQFLFKGQRKQTIYALMRESCENKIFSVHVYVTNPYFVNLRMPSTILSHTQNTSFFFLFFYTNCHIKS